MVAATSSAESRSNATNEFVDCSETVRQLLEAEFELGGPMIDINELQASVQRPAKGKVVAVMPAYNAAQTLERTVADIPPGTVDEIVLVDDCSRDSTADLARRMGLKVIVHEKNKGYGGNQKTCYKLALELGADYIVMIHPDYQYDSRVVGSAIEFLRLGICDVILGSRVRTRQEALAGGMPVWKYIANRALTTIENIALGQNLGDFHSGFRAYRREVLEKIPYDKNTDDFAFDSQFLAQAVHFGFKVGDIPVPVRYFDEASSINFKRCIKYGLVTLQVMAEFWLHKLRIKNCPYFKVDAK
jgi:glycosyltransferase involved in cell wall biosynthesis